MAKKIFIVCFFLFALSLIKAGPILYKGYAPTGNHDNLVLARNLAETGEYRIENLKNVVLATTELKKQGVDSTLGNKFTIFLGSKIFKILGFSPNLPFFASILLFAFSTVLIFLLVFKVSGNFYLALSAGLIDTFMPIVWKGSLFAGAYEFATVFFLFGLLIYLWKDKSLWALFLSGVFLGLAVVSRNAFLLSVIPVGLYALYKSYNIHKFKIKSLIKPTCLLAPALLIFIFMGAMNNSYISSSDESFTRYGHLFPDPYTYHFDKENYIKDTINTGDSDKVDFMHRYGYDVPLISHLRAYLDSAAFYPKQVFSIINFGGPIFLFLMFFGGIVLIREKKEFFYFAVTWFIFWYLSLILLKTNNWDHFLEIRFIIVIFMAYGAWGIVRALNKMDYDAKFKKSITIAFVMFLSFQLFISNRWLLHQDYETSFVAQAIEISEEINKSDLDNKEIIAVSHNQNASLILNYYTNKSFIYFSPETIKKLKTEEKLEEIFEYFGVTRYIEDNDF